MSEASWCAFLVAQFNRLLIFLIPILGLLLMLVLMLRFILTSEIRLYPVEAKIFLQMLLFAELVFVLEILWLFPLQVLVLLVPLVLFLTPVIIRRLIPTLNI